MLEILSKPNRQKLGMQGFTLIEVLITGGLIAILTGSLLTLSMNVLYQKKNADESLFVSKFRSQVINSLNSNVAFSITVNSNPSLSCLKTKSNCSAFIGSPQAISVSDPTGINLTNHLEAASGFSPQGLPCNTFSNTAGDDKCPFRFEVTWTPRCQAGKCTNPQNVFNGTLKYSPSGTKKAIVNTARLAFIVVQGEMDNSLENQCDSLKGTFDPITRTCRLPLRGMCPPNQVVSGIDPASNSKICKAMFVGLCPSGSALQYITNTGGISCKPITFCPVKTKFSTWIPASAVNGWTNDFGGDGGGDGGDGCDGSDGGCDGGS